MLRCWDDLPVPIKPLVEALLKATAVQKHLQGWDHLEIRTLPNGRSAQHVLCLCPPGDPDQPALVIKVSAEPDCAREFRANGGADVRALPGWMRARLLGRVCIGELGALAFGGLSGRTLTMCIAQNDFWAVDRVLETIFPHLQAAWYAQATAGINLQERYTERYLQDPTRIAKAQTRLITHVVDLLGARAVEGGIILEDRLFSLPAPILFCPQDPPYGLSATIHGDLNSDNIIVGTTHAALIDFERTGPGHVLEDLAALEASIRINSSIARPFPEIFETERQLAEDRGATYVDIEGIRKIRRFVRTQLDGREPWSNYLWATAVIGLRLMLADDLTPRAYAWIAAATLFAADALTTSRKAIA